MTTKDYFPNVIGQESAKAKLGFRLDNYKASGILPNLLFIAPKGCGKTMLAVYR
jgi:predicted ATPase with chaperone activity